MSSFHTPAEAARAPGIRAAQRTLLSVVVPVYCEEQGIAAVIARLEELAGHLPDVEMEIVFVNDGSTDGSLERLSEASARHRQVRVVDLARNFGKEVALSAGLQFAQGDAVVCMDADLQHPPELIAQMVAEWRAGAEIVATVRRSIRDQSLPRRVASRLFYWLMRNVAEIDLVAKSTDFCLLDRRVVDAFNAIAERDRSFRGLLQWLGYRRVWLQFDADAREHGRPRYSYARLLELAITNVIAYSSFPLRLIGYMGALLTVLSGLLLVWMLVSQAVDHERFVYTPLAMFVVGNTFVMGVILTTLGVMSLYIAKIHREVTGRPLFVVRSLVNFESDARPDSKAASGLR